MRYIEDGVTLIDSIVATKATISSNVRVERGSIISFGVVVGPGITLPPFTKLSTCDDRDISEKDLGEGIAFLLLVLIFVGGVGGEYVPKKKPEFGTEFVPQDWETEVKDEESDDSDDSDGEVHENARSSMFNTEAVLNLSRILKSDFNERYKLLCRWYCWRGFSSEL